MITIPAAITAGGTTELVFELADKHGKRLADIADDVVAVSLRQDATPRTRHEVPQLLATLDPHEATVTLRLGPAETMALAPPITATPKPVSTPCVGDVLIGGTDYYGPFRFTVRLPETYLGQAGPATGPAIVGIEATDIRPDGATIVLTIARADGSTVYLRYMRMDDSTWSAVGDMPADTETVRFLLAGLDEGAAYRVRASFDQSFTEGVAAYRFETPAPAVPRTRYLYFVPGASEAPPTESQMLAGAGATDTDHPEPLEVPDGPPGATEVRVWVILPGPATHISLAFASGLNQAGVFTLVQQTEIAGTGYWWYRSDQALVAAVSTYAWFADYDRSP